MVLLHSHTVRAGDEEPALRLAGSLWHTIADAPVAAMCFDVSATTPLAKSIEWGSRPAPSVTLSREDVERALETASLPDFASLISSREARTVLCKWLVLRVVERLKWGHMLLVIDDGVPMVYANSSTGEPSVVHRPDLARTLHGEADISCIYAAHVLRSEFLGGMGVVECCSVDTDLILIGCLNAFEGLRIRLHHFDKASKLPVFQTVDCAQLAASMSARYKLPLMEWATLVASRGTDYVQGGLILRAPSDWDVYLTNCAQALCDVKRTTGGRDLVTEERVDAAALHTTFVAASARMKRSKLRYEREDGVLARLAWNVLYMRHAPMRGGQGLDCEQFGWGVNAQGQVEARRVWRATHGWTGA